MRNRNIKTSQLTNVSESNFSRWLERIGLLANPFDRWNADSDADLPNYYIDNGKFDEFFQLKSPGIMFAKKGCGKTAQKQMIAAHCRPLANDSKQLAISYTYQGFERVLESVNHDLNQIHSRHHVHALLYLGVIALTEVAQKDTKIRNLLDSKTVNSRWHEYNRFFGSHWINSPGIAPSSISGLSSVELLQDFFVLLTDLGFNRCIVLVDGVDEFPSTTTRQHAITFLAPLLGTLAIIECPGFSFKFFLPAELESLITSSTWFRPDRVRIIHVAWKEKELLQLITQRLIHFSRRGHKYSDLAELCADNLRPTIDQELVTLSGELPRHLIILADKLINLHAQEINQQKLISLSTWERVKKWWEEDYLVKGEITGELREEATLKNRLEEAVIAGTSHPFLRVDEERGHVWLGQREVRHMIQGQVYSMLLCLYRHRGEVCNKEKIVDEVWPEVKVGNAVPDQDIAAAISRLRRILRKIAPGSQYIQTIKGKTRTEGGYRLQIDGF
jgi:hypothetical protein